MVEGPECKVKGDKMSKKILGLKIIHVEGAALNSKEKTKRTETRRKEESKFSKLLNQTIIDIQTLGKELFIFLTGQTFCLRMHFLMDGGFRLNDKKVDSEIGGEARTPTLLLHFSNGDQLAFNNSAADIRDTSATLAHIAELETLDICSEKFSARRALSRCLEQGGRPLCDMLLDQTVLPGVGNIIKNEALFDSGLMPDCDVASLSPQHVAHLVKMTRDFSMILYRCRRDGKPLWPYLKIYNKNTCKQCGGKLVKTKMGVDGGRLTWFCATCQTNNPGTRKITLPVKNSLLGWVQSDCSGGSQEKPPMNPTVRSEHEEPLPPWSCTACTFLNDAALLACEMCRTERNTDTQNHLNSASRQGPVTEESQKPINWTLDVTKHYQKPTTRTLDVTKHSQSLGGRSGNQAESRLDSKPSSSLNSVAVNTQKPMTRGLEWAKPPALPSLAPGDNFIEQNNKRKLITGEEYPSSSTVRKMGKVESHSCIENRPVLQNTLNTNFSGGSKQTQEFNGTGKTSLLKQSGVMETKARTFNLSCKKEEAAATQSKLTAPQCTKHNVQCRMRQVHKEGNNRNRMFWCCPAGTRCDFFQWADESFPICEGHGKRAVLRAVLKLGPNNGKKFFACPLPKNKQCGFFEWAVGVD